MVLVPLKPVKKGTIFSWNCLECLPVHSEENSWRGREGEKGRNFEFSALFLLLLLSLFCGSILFFWLT